MSETCVTTTTTAEVMVLKQRKTVDRPWHVVAPATKKDITDNRQIERSLILTGTKNPQHISLADLAVLKGQLILALRKPSDCLDNSINTLTVLLTWVALTIHTSKDKVIRQIDEAKRAFIQKGAIVLLPVAVYFALTVMAVEALGLIVTLCLSAHPLGMWFLFGCIATLGSLTIYTMR